jgi:hypothetical protein
MGPAAYGGVRAGGFDSLPTGPARSGLTRARVPEGGDLLSRGSWHPIAEGVDGSNSNPPVD